MQIKSAGLDDLMQIRGWYIPETDDRFLHMLCKLILISLLFLFCTNQNKNFKERIPLVNLKFNLTLSVHFTNIQV